MNRATLTKVHLLLASFMLPAAVMFLVTGGLYTWEFKGSYNSSEYAIALEEPLTPDLDLLTNVARSELDSRSVPYPTGKAELETLGTSFALEWTGSNLDVLLEPTDDSKVAVLKIKETTWYRNFVQLHKAKGGTPFKTYAAALATSLFLILLSGVLMAWSVPALRKQTIAALSAGLITFAIVVATS